MVRIKRTTWGKNHILLVIFLLIFSIQNSFSQISLDSYLETGSNAMSEGMYGNFSAGIAGQTGTLSASTSALFSFSNATNQVFSAYRIQLGNNFQLGKSPINISGLFLWKPISEQMRETNFGLLANYKTTHFGCTIGLNTRIYTFTQAAITQYNLADSVHTSLWEPRSVMYKFSYLLDLNSKLSLTASITNFDYYFIQQETNPMILLNLNYKLNNKLQLYSDLGYMQAGLLNMQVNYFGFYLRGGVKWKIN